MIAHSDFKVVQAVVLSWRDRKLSNSQGGIFFWALRAKVAAFMSCMQRNTGRIHLLIYKNKPKSKK